MRGAAWAAPVAFTVWFLILVMASVDALLTFTVNWNRVPQALRPSSSTVAGVVTVQIVAAVGTLIAIRRPRNVMGWLLLATGLTAEFFNLPPAYAGYALYVHPGLPGPLWLYWFSQVTWLLIFGELLVLMPLLFPDGRLMSRRWLIPIGLFGLLMLIGVLASLDPVVTSPLPNPAGVPALKGISNVFNTPILIVFFLGVCCSGPVALVIRYRRAGEQERLQLKWLLVAVAVILVATVLQVLVQPFSNTPILPIAVSSLPIAIGFAVLRYRLYDIDLILNKALVYGGLAVVITAVYVLIVIGFGAIVGNSRQFLLSIVTTALIALAFQPLRQRAQRLANRVVYGQRATPYETLSQFSEHLSQTFSEEDILERMARILAQGTGAERAEVWVRAGSRLALASSSPPLNGANAQELPMANGTLPAMERDQVVPVTHQGEVLGALAVSKKRGESMNLVEQQLITNLAAQAGLVLKNVGLNRELLARLEDLRASRQRLVAAQDDERRRLERNLHDGAQQHLVALKLKLGLAESAAEPDSKVHNMLKQLKSDADEALDTMRELARGIYPPLLASDGLGPALRAQARKSPVPVDLEFDDVPRQPREVEAAVYFCCLEALQNVSKYAEASRVRLRLWCADSRLRFLVEDNGKGFDPKRNSPSSGIQNMRDRLDSLAGTFSVRSEPGKGTTVEGSLPL
jgi:signal transduction histidine kinase